MTTFLTNNALDLPELASAPASPDTGRRKLYFGDDGYLYAVGSDGTVVRLQPTSDQAAALAGYQAALAEASEGEALLKTAEGVAFGAAGGVAYVAALSMTGSIIATVGHNTLGVSLSWSRVGTGHYRATAPSAVFTANKTVAIFTPTFVGSWVDGGRMTDTTVELFFFDAESNPVNVNYAVSGMMCQITVYP